MAGRKKQLAGEGNKSSALLQEAQQRREGGGFGRERHRPKG